MPHIFALPCIPCACIRPRFEIAPAPHAMVLAGLSISSRFWLMLIFFVIDDHWQGWCRVARWNMAKIPRQVKAGVLCGPDWQVQAVATGARTSTAHNSQGAF
jgi:hypothetical protein